MASNILFVSSHIILMANKLFFLFSQQILQFFLYPPSSLFLFVFFPCLLPDPITMLTYFAIFFVGIMASWVHFCYIKRQKNQELSIIIFIQDKFNKTMNTNVSMTQDSHQNTIKYDQLLQSSPENKTKNLVQKNDFFYTSDTETKASSFISSTSHETSFDFSQSSFESDLFKANDYFYSELLLQKEIRQEDIVFKHNSLKKEFIEAIKERIFKFVKQPSTSSFHTLLQCISLTSSKLIKDLQIKTFVQMTQNQNLCSVMYSLIVQNQCQFFVHTFDLVICPLSFFTLLMTWWVEPQMLLLLKEQNVHESKFFENKEREQDIRRSIGRIVETYAKLHSQQINQNQSLLLIILYLLDEVKILNDNRLEEIQTVQRNLVKDIKMFRRIQNLLKNDSLSGNSNKMFEQKLKKFERNHTFLSNPKLILQMIKTHVYEKFGRTSIREFYCFEDCTQSRKVYQSKKDSFCFWVLTNVIRESEKNYANTSIFVMKLMEILKKLNKQNNIEGVSYIVPIIANIKILLPKAWKYVLKRRPDIDPKLNGYTDFLLQYKSKKEELGENSIIWFETVYCFTEKVKKSVSNTHEIDLSLHKKYFEDFLSNFLFYRNRSKIYIMQQSFQLVLENEAENGFSFGLLQTYLCKKWLKIESVQLQWKKLAEKAKQINQLFSQSFFSGIFDFYFSSSRHQYLLADI